MQRRLMNYGDGFTQEVFKLYNLQHIPVGPIAGLEFNVIRPDTFSLTPGSVLMPNGILVVEDTEVVFDPIVPLPGLATVYTLKVKHEDAQLLGGGGQAATYHLVPTLSPALTNEVVLGYILHPGSGAPFAASMWRPTPRTRPDLYTANQLAYQPQIREPIHLGFTTLGTHITRSQILVGARLYDRFTADGTTPGPGDTVTVILPFTAGSARPRRVFANHVLPLTDSISIAICDTNGTIHNVASSAGGAVASVTHGEVPTSALFTQNESYYVRIVMTLHALNNGDLGTVRVTFDPLS
jgi:hypothetical protein